MWLDDHPGRTSKEYTKIQDSEEVWEWRRAKGKVASRPAPSCALMNMSPSKRRPSW